MTQRQRCGTQICWQHDYTEEVPCLNQQAVALSVPDRDKGKGRAVDLSPCTDTHTTDEWHALGSEESSVEVEQVLLCTEHGPDPRDFYASDSPVLDEYFDSGQGLGCVDPEVQDDDQVESILACHVWFSYLTYTSQANWCEAFPETSGPTAPVFACSAPVLHSAFTDGRAIVFTNRWAFVLTNSRAFVFTNC
jgi:hypothetical protein